MCHIADVVSGPYGRTKTLMERFNPTRTPAQPRALVAAVMRAPGAPWSPPPTPSHLPPAVAPLFTPNDYTLAT